MNKLSKRLACILSAIAFISPIMPRSNALAYNKDKEAYMLGNAHIDDAWNWRYEETIRECIPDTFNRALNLMDRNPDYHFSQSSSQLYKWTDEYYPEISAKIKEKVNKGQWDVVGGQVCEPDLNIISGESLVRQSLYAQKYFKQTFGEEKVPKVGWVPDVFGFSYNFPQILKKSGMDYFITTKLNWNEQVKWPYEVFRWKAPDGSEVLVSKPYKDYSWNGDVYGENINRVVGEIDTNDSVKNPAEMGLKTGIALYGSGDHGGGPNERDINDIIGTNADKGNVAAKMTNAIVAFKALEADVKKNSDKVPVVDNELYLQKHRGVYTTAGPMKKYNRMSEIRAEEAEKFSSISYLFNNTAYPKEKIQKAWERTTLNQFHDVLPGSAIAPVYVDAYNAAEIALNHLNTSTDYALETLKARINTNGEGIPIVVFNSLSWDRKNIVQAEVSFKSEIQGIKIQNYNDQEVPCQIIKREGNKIVVAFEATAPALGYGVYRAIPKNDSIKDTALIVDKENCTMENEYLRVEISKSTGNISRIYDKKNKREVFETGKEGNVLQYLQDTPREYHAWDMDKDDMQREAKDIGGLVSINLIENGPVKATYRVIKNDLKSKFVQDVTLYAESNKVDVKNNIDWNENDICLKVAFPMSVNPEKATYEIAYAAIDRPTSNEYRENGMFEVSGHKWADMSKDGYGISILNDSKYGWDTLNNRLRLTLLRAPHDRGGDSDRRKHHEFTYSIYPHSGDWKEANTVQKGYELNYPLIAKQTGVHNGDLENSKSFISSDKSNVIVSVFKKAEDSEDLIVRIYECNGQEGTNAKITLPANIKEAKEVNLLEEDMSTPVGMSINGNELTTSINKYEIKTFRIKFEKPKEFKNSRIKSTPIDLINVFNLDGMSYDSNRKDGNFDGNDEAISADLIPNKVITEDVEFNIGPKEDGKSNFVQPQGQTIDVNSESHKYLYILGCSTDKVNNKGEFKVNYSDGTSNSKELIFAEWKEQIGNMLNTYVKDDIGISLTHTHKSGNNTYDVNNNLFVYKVAVNPLKTVKSITLPKAESIKIAAMSFADGELMTTGDIEAPSKVNIKAETPKKNNSPYINLSWDAASDNKGVEKYIIYRATKVDMSDVKVIGETSATSYKDENMTEPTKYYYMVKAQDADGNISEASNIAEAMGGDLISFKKTVESNKTEGCNAVVDGDIKTEWKADISDGKENWIIIDLNEKLPISRFVVKNSEDSNYINRDYKIQISDDKTNWTDIAEVKDNKKSITEHAGNGVEGRYVKLLISKPGQGSYWSQYTVVREFEVHGEEVSPPTKAPEKATKITDIIQNENSITLNYEYVPKASSYTIKYGIESGKYDKEIKNNIGTKCTINGLILGKTYYFKVIPVNSIGEGPESEERSFKLEKEAQVKVDLDKYFNTDGISTLDNPKDGEFDGVGWAYDGNGIPDVIKVDKISFKIGSKEKGNKNVVGCKGQEIMLAKAKNKAIYLLGAAHEGDQSGKFVINYVDGAKEEKTINMTDWCSSPNSEETVAISMDHRISNGKREREGKCGPGVSIKMYSISLDISKSVKSITLPSQENMKLFAITLDGFEQVVEEKSSNAKLSDITLDGKVLEGFQADTLEYNYGLRIDADKVPIVTAVAEDSKAQLAVTQASSTTGSAIVLVTAEDGKTQMTYKIKFNNILKGIKELSSYRKSLW